MIVDTSSEATSMARRYEIALSRWLGSDVRCIVSDVAGTWKPCIAVALIHDGRSIHGGIH